MEEGTFAVRNINMGSFQKYLDNLENPPVNLSDNFAKKVRDVWVKLVAATNDNVKLPIAGPVEDGFNFCLQNKKKVIEIYIFLDGAIEWFFHDRESGLFEGTEEGSLELPERLITLLKDFGR